MTKIAALLVAASLLCAGTVQAVDITGGTPASDIDPYLNGGDEKLPEAQSAPSANADTADAQNCDSGAHTSPITVKGDKGDKGDTGDVGPAGKDGKNGGVVYVSQFVSIRYNRPTKTLTVYKNRRPVRQYYCPSAMWVKKVLVREGYTTRTDVDRIVDKAVGPVREMAQDALDSANRAGGTANLALTEARGAQAGVDGLKARVSALEDQVGPGGLIVLAIVAVVCVGGIIAIVLI